MTNPKNQRIAKLLGWKVYGDKGPGDTNYWVGPDGPGDLPDFYAPENLHPLTELATEELGTPLEIIYQIDDVGWWSVNDVAGLDLSSALIDALLEAKE